MDAYMAERGFPYRLTSVSQMFSSIMSKGSSIAAMANMDGHFFVGYYHSMAEAEAACAKVRRARKYRCIVAGAL